MINAAERWYTPSCDIFSGVIELCRRLGHEAFGEEDDEVWCTSLFIVHPNYSHLLAFNNVTLFSTKVPTNKLHLSELKKVKKKNKMRKWVKMSEIIIIIHFVLQTWVRIKWRSDQVLLQFNYSYEHEYWFNYDTIYKLLPKEAKKKISLNSRTLLYGHLLINKLWTLHHFMDNGLGPQLLNFL